MSKTAPTPQKTLVVLGATSAIAHAYLRLEAGDHRISKFVLVGRNSDKLKIVRKDIFARSHRDVLMVTGEIGDPKYVEPLMSEIGKLSGQIDECLIAFGSLGDQTTLRSDLSALNVALNTNFVAMGMWLEAFATKFEAQTHGHITVIGSVAGDRGRQSNYLYGASKAALERLCEGLAHRFARAEEIHITCIKPGLVISPMTAHIAERGLLWTSPDKVAQDIKRAIQKKRVRIYTPWFWRYILLTIRLLPIPLMHKTKL